MKFTWVIMTHADKDAEESVRYNLANAGSEVDEVIWVNNGGKGSLFLSELADRVIRNKKNLGIAKGYNPAFAIASGDYIIITGSDTRMPNNWLKVYREYVEKIPDTGVACMLNVPPEKAPERIRGERQTINGLDIIPCLPLGFRIISKKIFKECGYLREDFGLYGWDDVEFASRIITHTSLKCYIIPDYIPEHDVYHKWNKEYEDFKQREVNDKKKIELLRWCSENNFPKYNPYD